MRRNRWVLLFLDRYNGYSHGGNSKITEECREFMKRYEALLDEMQETGQKIFEKYFEKYFTLTVTKTFIRSLLLHR